MRMFFLQILTLRGNYCQAIALLRRGFEMGPFEILGGVKGCVCCRDTLPELFKVN